MMFLKKLELCCFRNYTRLCFFPSERTLIVGGNGQGKTNILEALVLLSYGRSFRAQIPESFVQRGKKSALISAEIFKESGGNQLKLSLENSGKKQFWINEKRSPALSLGLELPLIVFSPESLSLLKGSAEQRRMWLDNWLNMLGRGHAVRNFKKALIQKNSLLKQIRKGLVSGKKARPLLESLNEIFVEKSLHLVRARKQALQELSVFLKEGSAFIFKNFSKKNMENLKLETKILYWMKEQEGSKERGEQTQRREAEENTEESFRKEAEKRLFQEQEAGLSLYGAHRDDFLLSFQGQNSRYFCSQGQQRGLLLALKIAQILWLYRVQKKNCLLLLDDVFSEMDKQIVLNFLCFLKEVPSQIILTSTNIPVFLDKKQVQIFNLKEGVLRKRNFNTERETLCPKKDSKKGNEMLC